MGRVDGKVALVSGAARGLGASQAALLAREGARVVLTDVLTEEGEAAAAQIREAGGEALFARLDVTSERQWQEIVALTLGEYGKLDVLVNNAGVPLRKTLENTTEEEWDLTLAINLKGTFLGTKAAIPALRQAGGGSVINISSVSGIIASTGAAYGASKGAVRLLTNATAVTYASDGIRCNSVHPGPMDTEVNRESQLDAARWAERMRNVPLGRIGTPIEVAYGVLFLASDESSYMTGSELVIDGGSTAV
jgi:NAD(P)-dependent dehydrogenase (short-subunit alcohol dehydrogenase family)